MAYMDKNIKNTFRDNIKKLNKKFGVKATLSVEHYSTIILTVRSGIVDFTKNKKVGYFESRFIREEANRYYDEAMDILHHGNHSISDVMRDYFDADWYVEIRIGEWNKPYILQTEEIKKGGKIMNTLKEFLKYKNISQDEILKEIKKLENGGAWDIEYNTENESDYLFGVSRKLFNETVAIHFKVSKIKCEKKEEAINHVNLYKDYSIITFDDLEFASLACIKDYIFNLIK